jgi:hypothetical protein
VRAGIPERAVSDLLLSLTYLDPMAAPLLTILSRRTHPIAAGKFEWENSDGSLAWNYAETFHSVFGSSAIESSIKRPGETTERDRLRMEFGINHMQEIERVLLFGDRTHNSRRRSGGLAFFATKNVHERRRSLTGRGISRWVQGLFRSEPPPEVNLPLPVRVVLANEQVLKELEGSGLRLRSVDKSLAYGLGVQECKTAWGNLYLIQHRLLRDPIAYAVDPRRLGLGIVQPTVRLSNTGPRDVDAWQDEYQSELGLSFRDPAAHGSIVRRPSE